MLILAAFILQIILLVVVPIWFLIWLAFYRPPSYVALYVKTLLIGVFIGFFFIVGRWDIVGIWFRYLWIGIFILAFAWTQYRYRNMPLLPNLALRPAISLATTMALVIFLATGLWV